MQISSITDVIGGVLENSPSISFIYSIKTTVNKLTQGDLYFAKNKKDLSLAIEKGAFAVVYDFDVDIYDDEIAWIKVDSYRKSLIKIFRFKLATLDLKAFYCNDISFELFDIYKNSKKNIHLISSNFDKTLKTIDSLEKGDIIVCNDKVLLDKIYPNNVCFNNLSFSISNLTKHSLFETSFTYDNFYFNKLKITSLYVQDFLRVYDFLEENIDFSKLKNLDSFKPIFIDKFINTVDYGRSDKFIISQKNQNLVENELLYIKQIYKYATTIVITKEFIEGLSCEQFVISNVNNLKNFLLTKKFNCVYLIGYEIVKVEKSLIKSNLQKSLL